MNLGTAVGAIQLVYDGAGVAQAKQDLASLGQTQAKNQAQMAAAGAAIGGMGAGALKFIGDSVGIAADVEATLKSVEAATDATDAQLQSLDQTIGTIAKDTVFNAQEVAGASETMAKAGISVEDQLGGALKTVTDLAAATGEGVDLAAGTTADAMAMFGLSGEQVVQVADLTTQAVNASKIGLSEYNAGFRNLGPTMAGFADDSQEAIELLGDTGQVIAFFTSQGLKGADAGLSFARMIQNIATPSTEAYGQAIADAGIALFDAEGNFVGAEEAVRQFNKAFEGMTDQEVIEKLDQMGIGQEALDVVQMMANQGDVFPEFVEDMEASKTAAEAAEIRMEGFRGAIESLTGSVQEAMRQMGAGLLGPLESVIRGITELVNAFLTLPAPIQQAVGAFIGLFGVMATGVGAFIAFRAATGLLGIALGPLAGMILPIVVAIAALAAVGAALFLAYNTNFMGFGDLVNGVMADAAKAVDKFGKGFKAAFARGTAAGLNDAANGIQAFGDALLYATGIDITGFTDRVAAGVDAFGDAFQENATNNVPLLVNVLDSVGAALDALGFEEAGAKMQDAALAAQQFGDMFQNAMKVNAGEFTTGLAATIQSIGDALTEVTGIDFSSFAQNIAQGIDNIAFMAGQAADAIRDKLGQALDFLGSNVLPGVTSYLGNLWGTIRDIGKELVEGDFSQAGQILGDAIGQVGEWAGNVVQGLGDAIGSVDWGGVVQTIASGLGAALGGVADFITGGTLGNIAGAIGQTIMGAASAIGSFLGGLATIVANQITAALSGIANFITTTDFGSVVQRVSDYLLQAFNNLGGLLSGLATIVANHIGAALSGVANFISGIDFNSVVSGVGGFIEAAFSGIGTFLSAVPSTIGNALGTVLGTVGNFLGDLNFGNMVQTVVDAITGAFGGGGGGGVSGGFHGPGGGVSGAFSQVSQGLGSQLTQALNAIGDFIGQFDPGTMVTDIVNSITEKFNGATFDLSQFGENIKSALEEACGLDLSGIFDTLGTAVSNASIALGDFAAYMGGHIETIKGILEGVDFSGVFTTLTGAISAVRNALETLASEIGSKMQEVASALEGFSIPGAISAFGSLIATIMSRIQSLATDIPGHMQSIQSALDSITVPQVLTDLATKIGEVASAALDAAANIASFLGSFAGDKVAGAQDTASRIATLGPQIDGAVNGLVQSIFGASDQAVAAGGMQGDFATNFVGQIADSFANADWSPVTQAINTGLSNILSGAGGGGVGTGEGPQTAPGGQAMGQQFANQLVSDIAAGFTPEAFAPIKAAFDAAMTAAMAGGAEGAPAEGGGGDAIAQTIITSIAAGFGKGVETIKSALQAVIQSAGDGITGLETVGTEMISQISAGLGPALGTLTAALGAVVASAADYATTAATVFIPAGTAQVTAMATGVNAGLATLNAAVNSVITAAVATGVATANSSAPSIGQAIATAAAAAAASATELNGAVGTMVSAAIDAGVQAAAGASAIGAAVSEGAASGVILTAMNGAVETMVKNGIAAGMAAAEAASPSQVARRELGQPIGEGAAIGVDDSAPLVEDATASMMDGVMEAARPAIEAAIALFQRFGLEIPAAWQAFMEDAAPAAEEAMTATATETGEATGEALTESVETSMADGTTEVVDAAGAMGEQAGTAATEGVATGVEQAAPVVEESMTNTMTSGVDAAISAAEAAMENARSLFEKYGMTFGNDLNVNVAKGMAGATGGVGDAARAMADQIRANVEERIAAIQGKRVDMGNLNAMLDERDRRMNRPDQANQPVQINLTTELDSEVLDKRIVQTSISPMLQAFETIGERMEGGFF